MNDSVVRVIEFEEKEDFVEKGSVYYSLCSEENVELVVIEGGRGVLVEKMKRGFGKQSRHFVGMFHERMPRAEVIQDLKVEEMWQEKWDQGKMRKERKIPEKIDRRIVQLIKTDLEEMKRDLPWLIQEIEKEIEKVNFEMPKKSEEKRYFLEVFYLFYGMAEEKPENQKRKKEDGKFENENEKEKKKKEKKKEKHQKKIMEKKLRVVG